MARRKSARSAVSSPVDSSPADESSAPAASGDSQAQDIDLPAIATADDLHAFVAATFGVSLPRRAVCRGHDAPWDYIWQSFSQDRDFVVWSCRGGGKSFAAALTTTLRAMFHPRAEQVILGGSQEQSERVAEHVRSLLARVPQHVSPDSRRRRIQLVNGSVIHVLAQSETSVRGIHAEKVRCDEVELFDAQVWRALWFCTTGRRGGRGSLEALSTAHVPGGIMEGLIDRCRKGEYHGRLFVWCLWEVIERCEPTRRCEVCLLAGDCQGLARRGEGFFRIDDAIAIKARSSRSAWESEMLCRGAQRDWLVFNEFSESRHVAAVEYCPAWPLYRAIDFGYRSPMVCLWIQLTPGGAVHVLQEYSRSQLALTLHAEEIKRRDLGAVRATCVDPAGRQKESTSGEACTEILQAAGIPCECRHSTIVEGLELIRAALSPAAGPPRLVINPRCGELIRAFKTYHYPPPGQGAADVPVKDGPDHLLDALRYFFINRVRPAQGVDSAYY